MHVSCCLSAGVNASSRDFPSFGTGSSSRCSRSHCPPRLESRANVSVSVATIIGSRATRMQPRCTRCIRVKRCTHPCQTFLNRILRAGIRKAFLNLHDVHTKIRVVDDKSLINKCINICMCVYAKYPVTSGNGSCGSVEQIEVNKKVPLLIFAMIIHL